MNIRTFCVLLLAGTFWSINSIVIIVPGTWSVSASWHQPGGDFFDILQQNYAPESVFTFCWSGKNNHDARIVASRNLATLLNQFPIVTLVTHSHGTNVALLAINMLAEQDSQTRIPMLYALATPVASNDYIPNMNYIGHLVHLFSFSDTIQTMVSGYERVFTPHPRITNLAVLYNRKEPNHSEIHSPLCARWLPYLNQYITPGQDGVLQLSSNHNPELIIDDSFAVSVDLDQWLQQQISIGFWKFVRSKKNE
ncbi:hypothetical protein JW872_00765 [Candidatus Babeliales bacterium]|nr:hypothetical protein [Candidatus Babeliales bacterium]